MAVLESLEVRWVQGITSSNVEFVDKNTACYVCGNSIVFLNMNTRMRNVLQSPGRGIRTFTANSFSRTLALSEQKLHPSIFVYSYPELSLRCELKGTAKLDYTVLALSDAGPYLACCSSLPDYTITVWNWESGAPVCSHPLTEEDISTLAFNPVNWQQICAANSRSVTVWNIEKSNDVHMMKPSVIDLPAADGSAVVREVISSHVSNGKLTYFGPQMPNSAIAGLSGDRAKNFVPKSRVKSRLCPSAICWSASSQLYVGTREGFLLLINPETLLLTVLYKPLIEGNPSSEPNDCKGLLMQEGSFQSLALCSNGIFATGTDCVLRNIQIKGNQVEVVKTLAMEEAVSFLCCSPDYETLLLSSPTGRIYRYKPGLADKPVKVLDVLNGDFVAAAPLCTENNICVSVRESGELQLWSLDAGICIASISLQTNVTSLACCPIAQYVAVGTVTGHVLFVELTRKEEPRLVHRVHLYHVPVSHLVFSFNQGGNVLITGASEPHIFVLDARPSKAFEVIGYTVTIGATVSLSTQFVNESKEIKVLVLCDGEKEERKSKEHKEGNILLLLSISVQQITVSGSCVDLHGSLREDVLHSRVYETPDYLSSCVLGTRKVFGYCQQKKVLQIFQLPKLASKSSSTDEPLLLTPEKETEGHPLGPAIVHLSPHQNWLASVGRDGLLRICDVSSLEIYVQHQCHSSWLGGVRSVSFTPDSQTVITTGLRDGSLVCSKLRSKTPGTSKANTATQYGLSMVASFEELISSENPVLSRMTDLDSQAQSPLASVPHTAEVSESSHVTNKDESNMSQPSASSSRSTWLDEKLDAVLKEESQQFAGTRESIRNGLKELRETIQAMMQENESLPDMEKLELHEFNLDVEEQKRLQAEGEQEVDRVRKEIELENMAKRYQREVLKKEFWDQMKVKGKAIKAFHSEHEVQNYPMKERTAKELEELHRVETIRQTELSESNLQQETSEEKSKPPVEGEEEDEADGDAAQSLALTGSLSPQCGGFNPYLYSQISIHTREQKLNQITLLQDVIYKVKTAFNEEFEAVYKQKEQEISRVRDRNKRITDIMTELELQEVLWEPTLTDNERPERALTVNDSEIKVEKYLTPEQREREEQQRKEEEQRQLATKGDNIRDRALVYMMDGVLELKKEDILRMEVQQPEFMTKPEVQWTEEERRSYKEYEKKTKQLREEQEKYQKILEAEMKKLQTSIKDATQAFDGTLSKLFEKKVKSDMAIHQEELKIANLAYSLMIEEEILNREKHLTYKLEMARILKNETGEGLKKHREDVEAFQKIYDIAVADDKLLDKGFRKEFADVPRYLVDQLYKLYKRRPRVQRFRTQTDSTSPSSIRPLSGRAAAEGSLDMMKAMEELDAPEHMPEDLDLPVWERFCLARRAKVESEQQVKIKALTLAEMQAFLQNRTDEDENLQTEIKTLNNELNGLREERMRFCRDPMVQIVIKQGQVELETGDFIADYSGAVLLHRSVVEELNSVIRALGEQKIAGMIERKEIRKGIIQQEWEHKRMTMQMEDLSNKARDIQRLHLNQEIQEYLSESDYDNRMSKQVSALEKTSTLQEKTYQKKIENCKKLIKQLNRQAVLKKEKCAALDLQVASMEVAVAERRKIYEATETEESQENEVNQRYQDILRRKKLLNLAEAQTEELAALRAEVERLRRKTFPALPPLKPN